MKFITVRLARQARIVCIKIKNELRLSKTMNFGTRNCVVLICTLNIKFLTGMLNQTATHTTVLGTYLTQSTNMLKGKKMRLCTRVNF